MKTLSLSLISLGLAVAAPAQGTFHNLNFGLTRVPASTPPTTDVDPTLALPFWTAYGGTNQMTSVLYNGSTLGTLSVDLISPNDPLGNGGIPGQYTVILQSEPSGITPVSASIAQTAQIPVGAMALLFVATPPGGAAWQVTVGGQSIPVSEVAQVNSQFNEYAGNISSFAGQTEELRFTQPTGPIGGSMWLGEIQFSFVGVPEPTIAALLVAGGLLRAIWVFKRKGRNL